MSCKVVKREKLDQTSGGKALYEVEVIRRKEANGKEKDIKEKKDSQEYSNF